MASIKEKIQKLLALASSPNENEAKAALLKARELMAKHKLTEDDFNVKDAELVHIKCDAATWTSDSGNIWMTDLCKLLCDNYCCAAAWACKRSHRTYTLVITGMKSDVELCKSVIEYAVGFVSGEIKVLQRKYKGNSKSIAVSYARGFIVGLEMAFEQQEEEHKQEWGLVLSKPQEVADYESGLSNKSVKSRKPDFSPLAYMKGQVDGTNFSADKVLQG